MKFVQLVGRLLFALPLTIFGLFHFIGNAELSQVVPSFLPGQTIWVYLTGLALLIAGVSIILDLYTQFFSFILACLLLLIAFFIHLPAVLNPESMQMAIPDFLKDLALSGAAFMFSTLARKK